MNTARDHHYAPQFYLRNFSVDGERRRVPCVAKEGPVLVWKERSIRGLGYEEDLYVHRIRGVPVSVEERLNSGFETPISQSETWKKISDGRAETLDVSDRPILYALVRHLEARTPHFLETMMEL